MRDVSNQDGIRLWEFFSRRASTAAGKPVGFGPGRFISRGTIALRHGLALHRLPSGSATISFPGIDLLPEGSNPRISVAGVRSREERDAANVCDRAVKAARADARTARDTAALSKKAAAYSNLRTPCPRDCGAFFRSAMRLETHVRSGCGRHARAVQRRAQHGARTIRARLNAYDGDLANEEERLEEESIDLFTIIFRPGVVEYGLTIGVALDADDSAPLTHAGLTWRTPFNAADVRVGLLVRVSATHHEEVAREKFGYLWKTKFFYGKVHSRHGAVCNIEYVDDVYHNFVDDVTLGSHFKHLFIGSADEVPMVAMRAAIVTSIVLGGAASRACYSIGVGCTIVSVDGKETPHFVEARAALEAGTVMRAAAAAAPPLVACPPPSTPAIDAPLPEADAPLRLASSTPRRCTVVVLRRPPPTPKVRAWARPCCATAPAFVWREDVVVAFNALLNEPANKRRFQSVHSQLAARFGRKLDVETGMCVMPSMSDVEKRMIRHWKATKKPKSDASQNSAARALARAARGTRSASLDKEIIGDEYDDADSEDESDGSDDDGNIDGGDKVAGEMGVSKAPSAFNAHFLALDDITVTELRARLRARKKRSSVTASDIPAGTSMSGATKSAAVLRVLRVRLARVLASEDEGADVDEPP